MRFFYANGRYNYLIVKRFLTIVTGVPVIAGLSFMPVSMAWAASSDYFLEIDKSAQELRLMHGQQIVRRYHAALGGGGSGDKRVLGDGKTPVGYYKIIGLNQASRFHLFMQIDYPNMMDAWEAYEQQLISDRELIEIARSIKYQGVPPQDTALGGYIGIHGIGNTNAEKLRIHKQSNWTQGCVALTNEEINDLRRYVDVGTEVVILE